jgi:MFS family permease
MILFVYLDRFNLSFAAPTLKKDLNLTNSNYGLGAGLLFAGYAATQIPSSWICAKVGAKIWLPILMVLWGTILAATAAVKTKGQFYALRILLGLFEAGTFPGAWHHQTKFFSANELSFTHSAVTTASIISYVVNGPLAAGFLMMEGTHGLHGWQWLFIVEGIITVFYGLAFGFALPKNISKLWNLKPQERQWLQDRQETAKRVAKQKSPYNGTILGAILNWRLLYLAVAWWLIATTFIGVSTWVPLMLDAAFNGSFNGAAPAPKPKGWTAHDQAWYTAKLALISSLLYVPSAVFMQLVAWSSKHFKERNFHAAVPAIIGGIGYMCVPHAVQAAGAVPGFVAMTIASCGVWATIGPIWSWPATFLHGGALAPGIAFFNVFTAVGGFCGPYIIGSLSNNTGSYASSMYLFGAFNFAAALMCLFMTKGPHGDTEEQQASSDEKPAPPAELASVPQLNEDLAEKQGSQPARV